MVASARKPPAAGWRLDFQEINAEFDLAVANLNPDHFRHLDDAGVSFEAICRAGYVGIERVATTGRLYMPVTDGFPAVILAAWSPAAPSIYCAVENPEILDLIAFRTNAPATWWYRLGNLGLVLGEDRYLDATETGASLKVFNSPLAWLKGAGAGACLLDDCEARWSAERYAEDEAALEDWWRAAS